MGKIGNKYINFPCTMFRNVAGVAKTESDKGNCLKFE